MRVVNVEAKLQDGESSDRLIRRFFKKCKKVDIVREYLDKTSYFKTAREKRRDKRLKENFRKVKEKTN